MQVHELPVTSRFELFFCVIAAICIVMLAGCGYSGPSVTGSAIGGSVHGGRQPVIGSHIQLYAAGTEGDGSAAQPISEAVKSDIDGNFSIPAAYRCPSASAPVYIVARGGTPGPSLGDNSALVLTAMLGPCGSLTTSDIISVNEVTTVGTVWPLAAYITDATHLGSAANDPAFLAAVATVPEYVNIAQGNSPGVPSQTSYFAENSKLYSLADVLADCVSSSGGTAGDGSPCGLLFSTAAHATEGHYDGNVPADTLTAALRIAQNPKNNVAGIYGMVEAKSPFEPTLTTAPADWTLPLSYAVATPAISLATGIYASAQEVTISDSTPGSTIYYTTDGTTPTGSSLPYAGPISIAVTSTLKAIAILQGSQSAMASATLTIGPAHAATQLVFVQQPLNALTLATISPAVTVVVEDSNGNPVTTAADPVTLALAGGTGLAGTLTVSPQNGIATFSNLSVSSAGSGYTLLATSPNLSPAISAGFTISAPGSSTPAKAVKLAFLQQPSNALTQATISPAVTVVVEDSNGNPVTTAANPVTLAISGGAGLAGTLTVTPVKGIASFSTLSVGAAGNYTLSATSPSLTSATSSSFAITASGIGAALPAKLAFVQQPSNAVTQATIAPAVTVAVEDTNGNTVTSAINPVTLTLVGGTGLGGTLTATPQNGIATFSNLSVGAAGTYTLSATNPSLASATSASFTITVAVTPPISATGTTYYLSPTGSDSNSGLSASLPWLTPNHALNCGDVISAAPGTYSSPNFYTGKWGTVSCPGNNNVAWLQCATFDTCKIDATNGNQGIWVDESYWGISGFEVTTSPSAIYGTCFLAQPRASSPQNISHIIFANNIANGCSQSGFGSTPYGSSGKGVDYFIIVGNIIYNAASGNGSCASGISMWQPKATDTAAGTHMLIAGNFSWANTDGDPCAGTAPTDGEGINIDTWDNSQSGGTPYTGQGLIENNIEFLNGGYGIEVENNSAGSANANIYIKNNTMYGDQRDVYQEFCSGNGDLHLYNAHNVTAENNLIYTGFATDCGGKAFYSMAVSSGNSSNTVDYNYASGVSGNNTYTDGAGGFAFGSHNVIGTDPGFANPVNPGAPNCSGSASVPACMATVVANFKPTVAAAQSYGYQLPSTSGVYDALFPQWLCTVNLPAGLVTKGCQASQ